MVLYYIDHAGYYFHVLMHKLSFHQDDEAVFVYNKDFFSSNIPKQNVDERYTDVFKIRRNVLFPNKFNYWSSKLSFEELEDLIKKDMGIFFNKNNLDLKTFDEIYLVEDATRTFEVYSLMNNIDYNVLEIKSDWLKLMANKRPIYGLHKKMISEKRGVLKEFISSERNQLEAPFNDIPVTYFDFDRFYNKLKEKEKKMFIDIFAISKKLPQNFNLYCCDSTFLIRNTIDILWNEAYSAAELLLDYCFSKEAVVVKPHPKSDQDFMRDFDPVTKLEASVPVDIIKYIKGIKIKKLIAGASGSMSVLDGHVEEKVAIDPDYRRFFRFFNKTYFAFIIFDLINNHKTDIFHIGLIEGFVNTIKEMEIVNDYERVINQLTPDDNKAAQFIIAGSRKGMRKNESIDWIVDVHVDSVVCFVMESHELLHDLCELNESFLENTIPLVIDKEPFRNYVNADNTSEVLWVYSKNKRIREHIRKSICTMCIKKHLPYAGMELTLVIPSGIERKAIFSDFELFKLKSEFKKMKLEMESLKRN